MNFNKIEVSREFKDFKCTICSLYLSITPIYVLSDSSGYVCGRCKVPDNAIYLEFMDSLLKLLLFNCRYDTYGCNASLPLESVKSHEERCEYSTITCPYVACNTVLCSRLLKEHFTESHKEYVTSEEFNLKNSTHKNYMLKWNKFTFILQLQYLEPNLHFSLNYLKNLQNDGINYDNFKYNILIKSDTVNKEQFLAEYFLRPFSHKKPTLNDMDSVNIDNIRAVLNSNNLKFLIKLDDNKIEAREKDLNLETMNPPNNIFHRLPLNLRFNVSCPLKETGCRFSGNKTNLQDHLCLKHMEHIRSVGEENTGFFRNDNLCFTRIYFFDNKIFKLNFKYDKSSISCCVQELNQNKSREYEPKYIYKFVFLEPFYKGFQLVFTGKCYPFVENRDDFFNACILSKSMILPFVNDYGEFSRKLIIMKVGEEK